MQCLLSCRVQGEMKSFSKFWKEIAEIGAWVCGEFFFKTTFFPCSLQKKNLPLPLSIPLVQPACLHRLSSKIKAPKGLSCDFAWIIAMTRLLNTGIMFLCPVSSGEDAALALSFAFYLLRNTLSWPGKHQNSLIVFWATWGSQIPQMWPGLPYAFYYGVASMFLYHFLIHFWTQGGGLEIAQALQNLLNLVQEQLLTPRHRLVMSLVTAQTWCSHGKLCPDAFSIGTKLKTRLAEHCFTLITVGSATTHEMEPRTRQICRTGDWCANWDVLESIAQHCSASWLLMDLGHQWSGELKNGEEIA